jgi:hypothetical protein
LGDNMTRTLFAPAILLIVGGLASFGNGYAASNKEEYELQERCGKRAGEIFKREYGSGIKRDKDGSTNFGYKNHYNTKLNKCFFLESSRGYTEATDKKKVGFVMERLFDINENREYGSYFKRDEDSQPTECNVERKVCHSEKEWETLIKPYMDE